MIFSEAQEIAYIQNNEKLLLIIDRNVFERFFEPREQSKDLLILKKVETGRKEELQL
jgi:hypothetical protein